MNIDTAFSERKGTRLPEQNRKSEKRITHLRYSRPLCRKHEFRALSMRSLTEKRSVEHWICVEASVFEIE